MTSVLTSGTYELVRKHCRVCNPPDGKQKWIKTKIRQAKKFELVRKHCGVCN